MLYKYDLIRYLWKLAGAFIYFWCNIIFGSEISGFSGRGMGSEILFQLAD